jgi:hypothetical protein
MIEHIVIMRWNEGTTPQAIEAVLEALRALKNKIPNILDLTCGENFSDRSKGYTHALVVRFPDRAALANYIQHPDHQAVVQGLINPILADSLAVDYEF